MALGTSLCGTTKLHCCWLGKAGQCRYLVPSERDGYVWDCALRAKTGSWKKVHALPEYINNVKGNLVYYGVEVDCGDWPGGRVCNACGANK